MPRFSTRPLGVGMRRVVDTNVLVRLFVIDDVDQSGRAADLLNREILDLETTVILETEWVLRSAYRLDRLTVSNLLQKLLDHPNVRFAERDRVTAAVDLHAGGMDFADALHLLGAKMDDEFVTFDRALAGNAERRGSGIRVRLL